MTRDDEECCLAAVADMLEVYLTGEFDHQLVEVCFISSILFDVRLKCAIRTSAVKPSRKLLSYYEIPNKFDVSCRTVAL